MNPFEDFASEGGTPMSTAAGEPLADAGAVRAALTAGYSGAVAHEAPRLAWVVDHPRLVETYAAMLTSIEGLRFNAYDIEALADSMDDEKAVPFLLPGPAGLYLSALINRAPESRIVLRLRSHRCRFHFLGYRLANGRTLTLEGNAGDFTGAGLAGGTLVLKGETGSWCAAGMLAGQIHVHGNAGLHTGRWMHGGDIRVEGNIAAIGKPRYGGRIYQGDAEMTDETAPVQKQVGQP